MEQEEQHLAEGERHHDEIDAAGAQRESADGERGERRRRDRERQGQPERAGLVLRRRERQHIAGKAEERGVAQADEAAEADDEVQRHRQKPHDQDLGGELHVVGRNEERQRDRDGEKRDRQESARDHAPAHRSFVHRGHTLKSSS